MHSTKNSDPRHHSLQIAQQDKFYSRLLSKETSLANPSFRVYYGGASGSVPFLWESQPGTPKTAIATTTLPPLTPPPSYHSDHKKKHSKKGKGNPGSSRLISCLLPRLTSKKTNMPFSPPSTQSSSSSSLPLSSPSVSSSGSSGSNRRSRYSSPRSSFSSKADEDEESGDEGSPTSTLCYKVSHEGRGCYSMVFMKNALLSIVGGCHGSSQGTHA